MQNANLARLIISLFTTSLFTLPSQANACACGCGVFDVGTSSMLPTQQGGTVWLDYDFMNQDKNWHHSSSAPSANNDDKDIKTNFLTAGAQYMFNRSWGGEITVPYWQRHFTTADDNGNVNSFDHSSVGDVRLKGIYSGFSPDMSAGITFGVKLPTGDYSYANFDRDTEIGTGSTDLLLGAFDRGRFTGPFNWFVSGELDQPVLTIAQYRPGAEIDVLTGVYYNGWTVGNVKIAPVAELIGSYRAHDNGINANPDGSGYERLLVAPGIEVDANGYRLYGDVGVPVYQDVKGDQLTAGALFKLTISHSF